MLTNAVVSIYDISKLYLSSIQDNQKDLESATEILSEYLERDITQENILDIKQKVQDKSRWVLGISTGYCSEATEPQKK